ncbi:MAG: hypothetical protein KGL20_05250 [Rhodospirillales bacterium]|nr:hypothetical protein [Rhodospirillales bacterium]MDE2458625.1 hypothetical protein [Rhodospirillales bacterium]
MPQSQPPLKPPDKEGENENAKTKMERFRQLSQRLMTVPKGELGKNTPILKNDGESVE